MTADSFRIGDSGEVDGFQWRVLPGTKAPGDMVIEVRAPDWVRVRMEVALLLADFHYQVEDILFPPSQGKRGGEYFLAAIAEACQTAGFRSVAARIAKERNGGRYPVAARYKPLAPYAGNLEEGRLVADIRTSLAWIAWRDANPTVALLLEAISEVLDRYRVRAAA